MTHPTGTVFDIGYQSYTGAREGRSRGRMALFKDSIRVALGFGRGPRAKILPFAFIAILSAIGLIMALVAGAVERLGGAGTAERMNLPSHADYYGIASMIMFVFAAVVGPELLCRDRREGTINLYLVRPITSSDYVLSRWAAFLLVVTLAAWLPQVILLFGLAGGDPAPGAYLRAHWLDVPKFLLAGVVMALYTSTLALLTASFTTRRAYASVFMVGIFVISTPFTLGMAQEIGGGVGEWLSMFNLTNIPLHVNDIIFGEATGLTENAPARVFTSGTLVSWYLLWTFGALATLWARYRKLTP